MNFGKAKMSRTSATKATGFEDHLSEFVMKLETGPRMNQLVKVHVLGTLIRQIYCLTLLL